MAITPQDKKISQMPDIAPSVGMYVPLLDPTQLPPAQNVRASVASVLALVPPPSFASITGKPTTLAGYNITDGITSAAAFAAFQPINSGLTAISTLTTTAYGRDFLTLANASAARSYIGAGTGSGTVTSVNLTQPSAGITVSGGPITTAGSITLALADDLAALEALSGTNTIYYRSGTSAWTAVSIGSNLTFSGGTLSASSPGTGTVTSFSSGNLSPLFTTNVATATTTPALSFSLSNQSANTVFSGPSTGSPSAPSFRSLVLNDLPTITAANVTFNPAGLQVITPSATNVQSAITEVDSALVTSRSTGVLFGGAITGLGAATATVSAGAGWILDNTNPMSPSNYNVSWSITSSIALSSGLNWIYVDNTGTINVTTTEPSNSDYRINIQLGRISVTGGVISGITPNLVLPRQVAPQIWDVFQAYGLVKRGQSPTASGANLKVKLNAGSLYSPGINFSTSPTDPHQITYGVFDSGVSSVFRMVKQDGVIASDVTDLPVGLYDNGGTLTSVPGGSFTTFTVFRFPGGNVRILYGQVVYPNLVQAVNSVGNYSPILPVGLNDGEAIIVGYIFARGNATDLSDASQASFIKTNNLGGIGGGVATSAPETDHNALANLQGGTTNQFYHLTSNEHTGYQALGVSTLGVISGGTWQGGVIAATYGGTGSAFVQFSGPASTVKTFTLPNANSTIYTSNTNAAYTSLPFTLAGSRLLGNSGIVGTVQEISIGSGLTLSSSTLSLTNTAITIAGTSTSLGGSISRDTITGVSSNGILARTAANTLTNRTITGTANEIALANGDGVSGNPTISLPSSLTFTGKTITGGTFASGAFNGTVGATTPSTGAFTAIASTGDIILTKSVPALRLRGTEGSAKNIAIYESAGVLTVGEESVSDWFRITSTGLNNTAIGATTPSTGAFTTVTINTKAVSEGAADSGGVGFRLLRVPN